MKKLLALLLAGASALLIYFYLEDSQTGPGSEVSNTETVGMITQVVEVDYVEVNEQTPPRHPYFPLADCASSRLFVGDYVYVSYGGTPNGIRSDPDVHPADNIIGKAEQGEGMTIVGGPSCSYGWILWEVVTDNQLHGWTPESDGEEFWLVPVDNPRPLASEVSQNPANYAAYQEADSIMSNNTLSDAQKRERLRVLQNSYGEEVVTTIMRYVPVYDSERGKLVSFDSYMRGMASNFGYSSSNSPIEQDPVGASISIFFDPSVENITQQLGLDDWP